MLALALAGLLAGPPVDPDFEAGKAAFAEGRFADAAERFERAWKRQREPLLLFVWAQAERRAGHCEVAVPLYRRYLELDPPEADVKITRQAIEACGEDPEAVPEPPPAPDGSGSGPDQGEELDLELDPDADPDEDGGGQTDPDRPRRALRDPWGHALTWPGVALVGVGGGLLGAAHQRRASSERAPHEQAYRDALEGAPILSRAGIGVLVGGGVLLVAGVVRFAVVATRGRPADEGALRAGGTGLVWKFELAPRRSRALR